MPFGHHAPGSIIVTRLLRSILTQGIRWLRWAGDDGPCPSGGPGAPKGTPARLAANPQTARDRPQLWVRISLCSPRGASTQHHLRPQAGRVSEVSHKISLVLTAILQERHLHQLPRVLPLLQAAQAGSGGHVGDGAV